MNGIAFIKPGVTIDEFQEDVNSAQLLNETSIEFTMPKTNTIFANKRAIWKAAMDKYYKVQKTKKLKETLVTFAGECKDRTKAIYKIDPSDEVTISNEYFTDSGQGEKHVDLDFVPYEYETEANGKRYLTAEVLLIWRVYCVGTARPKGDDASNKPISKMDKLNKMLGGQSI